MGRKTRKVEKGALVWGAALTALAAVAFLTALLAWNQLKEYEGAALELCASEQDRSVELILRQISRMPDCTDEEIIALLSGEQAFSDRYWVFSRGQLLRFVQDEPYTEKYQDTPAAAYFSSDSAAAFFAALQNGSVTHGEVAVDGKTYLISGAAFVCRGESAQIFLLTLKTGLLSDSRFFTARFQLYTLLAATLFLLLLLAALLTLRLWWSRKRAAQGRRELETALRRLSRSDRERALLRDHLWRSDMLAGFLDKLRQRGVAPLTQAAVRCNSRQARARLLQKADALLEDSVLRFEAGETDVIFLFPRRSPEQASAALAPLAAEEVSLGRPYLVDREEERDGADRRAGLSSG